MSKKSLIAPALTLADLSKDELLAVIALLPIQPSQYAIDIARSQTLQERAHAAFEKSQKALARFPDRDAWEEHKRLWKLYNRLTDQADALLERR